MAAANEFMQAGARAGEITAPARGPGRTGGDDPMTDAEIDAAEITLVRGAIHRPDEPRHFMRLKPVAGRVRVLREGALLAETAGALRCLEAGRDLYDPVLYLPMGDVRARLAQAERRTHCPLKGDATYFDLHDEAGAVACPEIAWAYADPFPFARDLAGRVAFDAARVTLEEAPAA